MHSTATQKYHYCNALLEVCKFRVTELNYFFLTLVSTGIIISKTKTKCALILEQNTVHMKHPKAWFYEEYWTLHESESLVVQAIEIVQEVEDFIQTW